MKKIVLLLLLLLSLNSCRPAELTTARLRDNPRYSLSDSAEITVLSSPDTVFPGDTATVSITGSPGVMYDIAVHYSSSASAAKGLEPKLAGEDGVAVWSWKIGNQTKPGHYRITISGGGKLVELPFTVAEKG